MKTVPRACALAAALSLVSAIACSNTTGGVPIELTIALGGSSGSFVTSSGWEIELTDAKAVVAPIYAYAPDGAMAFRSIVGPSRAFAHGGFDPLADRLVRAELLDEAVIDALAAPADVSIADGLAGTIDALTIVLAAPASDDARDATQGHDVWMAGTARRDDVEVAIDAGIDLDDPMLRRIEGVPVADGALEDGGRLVITADAHEWLAEADFTDVVAGDDAVAHLGMDDEPYRALWLGVRSAAGWSGRTEAQ
jgi:hypothetical protein